VTFDAKLTSKTHTEVEPGTKSLTRLTKPEKAAMLDLLIDFLHKTDQFSFPNVFDQALGKRNVWRVGEEREFKLLLNRAMNVLLDEGIDFGVVSGSPGTYERKDYRQSGRRSKGWRKKGLRAFERGVKRALIAAQLAPAEEREKLARSADWQALKLAMASRSPGKKLPPGLEE
jgi:hypothetical protein